MDLTVLERSFDRSLLQLQYRSIENETITDTLRNDKYKVLNFQ